MEIKKHKTKKNNFLLNGIKVKISKKIQNKLLPLLKNKNYEEAKKLVEDFWKQRFKQRLIMFALLFCLIICGIIYNNVSAGFVPFSGPGLLLFTLPLSGVVSLLVDIIINDEDINQIKEIIEKEIIFEKNRENIKIFKSEKNEEQEQTKNNNNNNFNFEESILKNSDNNNSNNMGKIYDLDDYKKNKR